MREACAGLPAGHVSFNFAKLTSNASSTGVPHNAQYLRSLSFCRLGHEGGLVSEIKDGICKFSEGGSQGNEDSIRFDSLRFTRGSSTMDPNIPFLASR